MYVPSLPLPPATNFFVTSMPHALARLPLARKETVKIATQVRQTCIREHSKEWLTDCLNKGWTLELAKENAVLYHLMFKKPQQGRT